MSGHFATKLMHYNNACLLALNETLLKEQDLQSALEVEGFGVPFCLGRDSTVSGKITL